MTPASTLKLPVLAALAAAFLCIGGALPALALDDDGKEPPWKTLFSLTGLGGKETDAEIDYRDRAPLVLPPKSGAGLRPPLEAGPQRGANWPQDPDVLRRAKAIADAKVPVKSIGNGSTQMSKDELLAGRTSGPAPIFNPATDSYNGRVWLNPDVIRSQQREVKGKESVLAVGIEPDRQNLTQPPPGYRKPTKDVKVTLSKPQGADDGVGQRSFFQKLNPFASDDD